MIDGASYRHDAFISYSTAGTGRLGTALELCLEAVGKSWDQATAVLGIIQEVIDPTLTSRQHGARVRELAARAHPGPFGEPMQGHPAHHRPVGAGLAHRRVRGAGAPAGQGDSAHRLQTILTVKTPAHGPTTRPGAGHPSAVLTSQARRYGPGRAERSRSSIVGRSRGPQPRPVTAAAPTGRRGPDAWPSLGLTRTTTGNRWSLKHRRRGPSMRSS